MPVTLNSLNCLMMVNNDHYLKSLKRVVLVRMRRMMMMMPITAAVRLVTKLFKPQ